ncbi:MAG: site-specific integrase [Blastomonas sp.]|uniref:tyrosine-type recombinase/integrase n=1 Tax=Blastomonas sp. TaxID=1909299 RepID=UPI0025834AF6|nr:site-specific integrase [Blastomonas sp.]MCO5794013.1 site-specific integrase [Blastomonas sp.]
MAIRKRQWTAPDGSAKQAWLVDYRDGMGHRRSKQFEKKKEAEAWQIKAKSEVIAGIHTPDSVSITVKDAAALWQARIKADDRERGTLKHYDQLCRLHIVPLLGAERLSRLTRPRIEQYRDDLLRDRSRAMAGKALVALSGIISEAQRRGLVAQNVAHGVRVKIASRDKPKPAIPTSSELKAILGAAPADMHPLLLTAILTGLRVSELRGLRWQDIDLHAGTLSVNQRADKFGQIGSPKSKAAYRTIPIAPALTSELRKWKLACPIGELGLVFPNTAGGVQDYGHLLRRKFHPLLIKAGVCDATGEVKDDKPVMQARYGFHAFRHAAASAWIKSNIDLKRLQVWMGHEDIQLTLNTYGHLIKDADGDAALIAAAHASLLL